MFVRLIIECGLAVLIDSIIAHIRLGIFISYIIGPVRLSRGIKINRFRSCEDNYNCCHFTF